MTPSTISAILDQVKRSILSHDDARRLLDGFHDVIATQRAACVADDARVAAAHAELNRIDPQSTASAERMMARLMASQRR